MRFSHLHFGEKRNPRDDVDELAIVKAAAWAWYQHGSGSEGRLMREFDALRTKAAPKPSRYKIEAMKRMQEIDHEFSQKVYDSVRSSFSQVKDSAQLNGSSDHLDSTMLPSPKSTSINDVKKPLLDKYEIERIERQLGYYIQSSQANYYGGSSTSEDDSSKRMVAVISKGETLKSKAKKKKPKGFWLRHGAVCGSSRDDVVESKNFGQPRRWPGKHVPVVKVVNCRPWPGHAQ